MKIEWCSGLGFGLAKGHSEGFSLLHSQVKWTGGDSKAIDADCIITTPDVKHKKTLTCA